MVKCIVFEGISRLYYFALGQIQNSNLQLLLFFNNIQIDDHNTDPIPNVIKSQ